jgi:hypothetical protein
MEPLLFVNARDHHMVALVQPLLEKAVEGRVTRHFGTALAIASRSLIHIAERAAGSNGTGDDCRCSSNHRIRYD